MRKKFIKFTELEDNDWGVGNHKKEHLGMIVWKNWGKNSQYVFEPEGHGFAGNTYFAANCLEEITDKLKELNIKKEVKE